MSSPADKLITLYKKFVTSNVELVGTIESVARLFSYVIPVESPALSELFSSAVSLTIVLNDYILRKTAKLQSHVPNNISKLSFYLNLLGELEVLFEITAFENGGDVKRWAVVVIIQIIKVLLRLLLSTYFKCGIISNSETSPLKRDHHLQSLLSTLKRGKHDRQSNYIQNTGSVESLSKPNDEWISSSGHFAHPYKPTPLSGRRMAAECLHITRPLIHLSSSYLFGLKSWKPWLLSFAVDMSSLLMVGTAKDLNCVEQEEMRRRTIMMMLYLLRSPFYDRYSKSKILLTFAYLAHQFPLLRIVLNPLMNYLPEWQRVYFYVWGS